MRVNTVQGQVTWAGTARRPGEALQQTTAKISTRGVGGSKMSTATAAPENQAESGWPLTRVLQGGADGSGHSKESFVKNLADRSSSLGASLLPPLVSIRDISTEPLA